MKYAIISDVHANLIALRNVIADAKNQGVDKFVCLGDVVGYGPQPSETLALVRKTCSVTLAGNHDDAVSGRGDSSTFVDLAKEAVERHREALSEDDAAWLRSLPYSCTLDKAIAAHGDVFDPPKFYYILNEDGAEANFRSTDARLVFVGHTHEPAIFLTGRSGKVYKTAPQDFTVEEQKRYIVNPGSVGYPRGEDGQCQSSYVIYDSDEGTVVFRFIPFLVSSVMQRGAGAHPLRRRIIAAACVAAALVAGLLAWFLTPKSIEVVDDPALIVETREIPLDANYKKVNANLTLAKGSSPVLVRIEFENSSNEVAEVKSRTVSHQLQKSGIKIPRDSVKARFVLSKIRREDSVQIESFAPSASAK